MENNIPVSSALSYYISDGKLDKNPATDYLMFKRMEKKINLFIDETDDLSNFVSSRSFAFSTKQNLKNKITKYLDRLKHDNLVKCYTVFEEKGIEELISEVLHLLNKKTRK